MNDDARAAGSLEISLEIELMEIELIGGEDRSLTTAAAAAFARLGVSHGHLAIEIVEAERIRELNREFRGKDAPTDVLSFPVDGESVARGELPATLGEPVEFGDVVICPAHTEDMTEATVHGVLHVCGFDHENDDGEMLALQDEIVAGLRGSGGGE